MRKATLLSQKSYTLKRIFFKLKDNYQVFEKLLRKRAAQQQPLETDRIQSQIRQVDGQIALLELEMVYAQKQIDSILDNSECFDFESYIGDDHVCLGLIYQNRYDHFRVCTQLCYLKPEYLKDLELHEESFQDAEYRLSKAEQNMAKLILNRNNDEIPKDQKYYRYRTRTFEIMGAAEVIARKGLLDTECQTLFDQAPHKKRHIKEKLKQQQRILCSIKQELGGESSFKVNEWNISNEVEYCHDLLQMRMRQPAVEMDIELSKSYSSVVTVLKTSANLRQKMCDVKDKLENSIIPESLKNSVSSLLSLWRENLKYRKNSALQFLLTQEGALPNRIINLRKYIAPIDLQSLNDMSNKEYKVTINPHKSFTREVWKLY